jgi:hypothetical protein
VVADESCLGAGLKFKAADYFGSVKLDCALAARERSGDRCIGQTFSEISECRQLTGGELRRARDRGAKPSRNGSRVHLKGQLRSALGHGITVSGL